uniref:PIH1D1/2/3 CS-like domain-containing protein n=1 Tax=Clastoptera arizonana TaxID=38151 RepID=A0A1B6D7A6_9HEMI
MDFSGIDIKKLAELFHQNEDSSSEDDDLPRSAVSKLGPGDVPSMVKVRSTEGNEENIDRSVETDSKSIWNLNEVPEVPVCDDASYDPRQRPDYEFTYRQYVGAEDLYLQLGQKTPATASCEKMIIIIKLPGEKKADIDICLNKHHLDLRSPMYRLSLALPHEVDPDTSSGEWRESKSTLTITLTLRREFDFVNF